MVQQTLSGNVIYGPVNNFQIGDLPQTGLGAGTVTLEVLRQLQQELGGASEGWKVIESASGGTVDTSALRANLSLLQVRLAVQQSQLQLLMNGGIGQIDLGQISGKSVFLNKDSLALVDRLFAAYLVNGRNAGVVVNNRIALSTASTGCTDTLTCVRDSLYPSVTVGSQGLLDAFEHVQKMGLALAGLTEAGAHAFGATSIAGAAGVAAPIIYVTTTIAPGVVGLCSLSMAEPFIELELGRPLEEADFDRYYDHLETGSKELILEQLGKELLQDALPAAGADEAMIEFVSAYLPASIEVLLLQDYTKPDSVTYQAFANAGSVFSNMPRTTVHLAISMTGNGSGYVTGTEDGINCGDGCFTYLRGVSVTLTPVPTLGSAFVGWSGDAFGTGSATLIMNSNKTVIAQFMATPTCTFEIAPSTANVSPDGGTGSLSVTTSFAACSWTAASNNSFITITSSGKGTGNGTVSYSVAANTSTSQRTGTITIQGNTFTVTQAGATPNTGWSGTWSGPWVQYMAAFGEEIDSNLTWVLTQNGNKVSGTYVEVITYSDLGDPPGTTYSGTLLNGIITGDSLTIQSDGGNVFTGTISGTTIKGTGGDHLFQGPFTLQKK